MFKKHSVEIYENLIEFFKVFIVLVVSISDCFGNPIIVEAPKNSINIGPCTWIVDRKCPDNDIEFYLFTRQNHDNRQYIKIDETWEQSNLSTSYFNPYHPVKIIIHGYNSDMFLHPLVQMKDEYLQRGNYNLLYVDWSQLSPGPCYLSAVHNTRHVGKCIGQLIERVLEAGTANIHLIGFSLGAQVTNFVANSLGSFFIPRITGLDPAMPLFITVSDEDKLDPSDAAFVDVIHTNALVQGKIERCGHVDFYMNGGIIQPGCFGQSENPFACSHHRAPDYYAESIRSYRGFWGWQCSSYVNYLLGLCPSTNYLVLAGEDCDPDTNGMYLINTNSEAPFAKGKWTDIDYPIQSGPTTTTSTTTTQFNQLDLLSKEIDEWGKLDSNYNNIMHFPTPYSQDPNGGNYPYFGHDGTKEITNHIINDNRLKNENAPCNDTTATATTASVHRNTPTYHNLRKTLIKPKINKIKTTTVIPNNLKSRTKFIEEYKRNLTKGIFDRSVFQLPTVSLD